MGFAGMGLCVRPLVASKGRVSGSRHPGLNVAQSLPVGALWGKGQSLRNLLFSPVSGVGVPTLSGVTRMKSNQVVSVKRLAWPSLALRGVGGRDVLAWASRADGPASSPSEAWGLDRVLFMTVSGARTPLAMRDFPGWEPGPLSTPSSLRLCWPVPCGRCRAGGLWATPSRVLSPYPCLRMIVSPSPPTTHPFLCCQERRPIPTPPAVLVFK